MSFPHYVCSILLLTFHPSLTITTHSPRTTTHLQSQNQHQLTENMKFSIVTVVALVVGIISAAPAPATNEPCGAGESFCDVSIQPAQPHLSPSLTNSRNHPDTVAPTTPATPATLLTISHARRAAPAVTIPRVSPAVCPALASQCSEWSSHFTCDHRTSLSDGVCLSGVLHRAID